jgi:hypothetical protein
MPAVGDVFSIFLLSLLAMFNPTLLAAVTVMMLLPQPKKLIVGFLLGAYLSAIGLGLAIVYTLHGDSGVESSKSTLSPLEDIVFGVILLIVGWVLLSGRAAKARERRKERHDAKHAGEEKKQSFPERILGRGSARLSFVALDKIAKLGWPAPSKAIAVIIFVIIEMLLLEVPLVGFWLAPEKTEAAIVKFRAWISTNAARAGGHVCLVLGALLIIRGAAYLIFG